jgi:Mce-associated membrane protein
MADDADSAAELTRSQPSAAEDQRPPADVEAHTDTSAQPLEGDAVIGDGQDRPERPLRGVVKLTTAVGLTTVVLLVSLSGWLGFRAYQSRTAAEKRAQFIEVGKQGALNLTTIDWRRADADVQRILDSATGTFYDDFSKRSQPFVEVVKKTQSQTVGTVTEAGLESESGDQAQVLVTVSVKTSNTAAPEQNPRAWRMRISVQKVGADVKVADVAFVP